MQASILWSQNLYQKGTVSAQKDAREVSAVIRWRHFLRVHLSAC